MWLGLHLWVALDNIKFETIDPEEFHLPDVYLGATSEFLPQNVRKACLASVQRPVNPHAQRLLVAANKPVGVPKGVKPKSKTAKPKGKAKAKAKAKAHAKEGQGGSKTAYGRAKDAYKIQPLGLQNPVYKP